MGVLHASGGGAPCDTAVCCLSVGFALIRAADCSAKSARAPCPYGEALIKAIWKGSDRVAANSNRSAGRLSPDAPNQRHTSLGAFVWSGALIRGSGMAPSAARRGHPRRGLVLRGIDRPGSRRRRGCHSADTPSPSLLKDLRTGEGVQQNDSLADRCAQDYPNRSAASPFPETVPIANRLVRIDSALLSDG